MQSIQQTTPARYPGLSIEHGEIRQFGKPRHCAANRRGQYQTTLRDQAGRYRTTTHAQTPCTPQKPPPFSARDVSIRERNQPEQEP